MLSDSSTFVLNVKIACFFAGHQFIEKCISLFNDEFEQ